MARRSATLVGRPRIYPWQYRTGINLTSDAYDGATFASWGVTLVRENPTVTWTHQATGLTLSQCNVTLSDGHTVVWAPPNSDSRVWNPTFDWASFDARLDDLEAHGVGFVVDPHSFPWFPRADTMAGYYPFCFDWQYILNAAEYWRQVARHCKARGAVIIGYDIVNEPCFPNKGSGTPYPSVLTAATVPSPSAQAAFPGWRAADPAWQAGGADPRSYVAFVNACVAAIRAEDQRHAIIVEWDGLGGSGEWTTCQTYGAGSYVDRWVNNANWYVPAGDRNIVLSLHHYKPASFSTQNVQNLGYPAAGWSGVTGTLDAAWLESSVAALDAFLAAHPEIKGVLIGECGPDHVIDAGGEKAGADQYLTDLTDLFKRRGWSWAYHTVNNGGLQSAHPGQAFFNVLQSRWNA